MRSRCCWVLVCCAILLLPALLAVSQAQITLDGSLGPQGPLPGPHYRLGGSRILHYRQIVADLVAAVQLVKDLNTEVKELFDTAVEQFPPVLERPPDKPRQNCRGLCHSR